MSSDTDRPVLPVRRVWVRYDAGRWVPCPVGAASMVLDVDAAGRAVQAVWANPFDRAGGRVLGWRLTAGGAGVDPAEVVAWLEREAARRRRT